ncbi:MAG TPA: cupredoxin domain-containing protein [Roseiflexaceae bacterium]|nr:cupredoxin domain-containing protein [Roseiflexaceae bacterium]
MATVATPIAKRRDWRAIAFRAVAALSAPLFLVLQPGLLALLEPWVLVAPDAPGYTAAIHRMHEAHWATIMVFGYGLGLLALAWRPRALPGLAQFVLLVTLIEFTSSVLVGQADLFSIIYLAIFVAAYPAPRDLLHFSPVGPPSAPLLGLSLLTTALLAPDAWRSLHLQLAGLGGEHATQNHWMLTTNLELILVMGSLFVAAKRPGWRVLGLLVGLALVYLGLASISAPQFDGSWGTLGGALATLGGWGFVGATLWEARRPTATVAQRGWLPYMLIASAVCLSTLLFAAPWSGAAAGDAAPAGTTVLVAQDFQFDQIELHVKAGAPVALQLDNRDGSIHQFDLDEFNVHIPMPAGQHIVAQFTPTQPGAYTFYCVLHVDRATKHGMAGTLVVTP